MDKECVNFIISNVVEIKNEKEFKISVPENIAKEGVIDSVDKIVETKITKGKCDDIIVVGDENDNP